MSIVATIRYKREKLKEKVDPEVIPSFGAQILKIISES